MSIYCINCASLCICLVPNNDYIFSVKQTCSAWQDVKESASLSMCPFFSLSGNVGLEIRAKIYWRASRVCPWSDYKRTRSLTRAHHDLQQYLHLWEPVLICGIDKMDHTLGGIPISVFVNTRHTVLHYLFYCISGQKFIFRNSFRRASSCYVTIAF